MSQFTVTHSATGVILSVYLSDATATKVTGKTGLLYTTSGLTITTRASNEAAATTYTSAGATTEDITTLGTYQTPSSGKCRFKEQGVGWYEIHLLNARFSVSGATFLRITVSGLTNVDDASFIVDLTRFDLQSANPATNVTHWNSNSLGTQQQSGYPSVTIKTGAGAGELAITSGIAMADLRYLLGSVLSEAASGRLSAAFQAFFDVATPALNVGSANQTGDAYARIGAPVGASVSADIAAAKAIIDGLNTRLTAARAGYLDNLNAGGVLASQADINALNQSASRRSILTVLAQWERPESGSFTKLIELRTWDGDGAPANADSDPSITIVGTTTGSLAGNLSVVSNPTTGVYQWTYTGTSSDNLEDIRTEVSPTIGGTAYPVAAVSQLLDQVAAKWTTADATRLSEMHAKIPSRGFFAGSSQASGSLDAADKTGFQISGTKTTLDDLNDLNSTTVQSAANAALTALFLDKLFAAAYDPSSKPGNANALLNVIVENDSGVPRGTANFLELAPSGGGGGDATAANQATIISAIAAIQKLIRADIYTDTNSGNLQLVLYEEGTNTELYRKNLLQFDGSPVTAVTHVVARHTKA